VLTFFILFLVFLVINALEYPAFNVVQVLRVALEGGPNVTGLPFLFRAFRQFIAFHDSRPFAAIIKIS
jgi:hypothetical protein